MSEINLIFQKTHPERLDMRYRVNRQYVRRVKPPKLKALPGQLKLDLAQPQTHLIDASLKFCPHCKTRLRRIDKSSHSRKCDCSVWESTLNTPTLERKQVKELQR